MGYTEQEYTGADKMEVYFTPDITAVNQHLDLEMDTQNQHSKGVFTAHKHIRSVPSKNTELHTDCFPLASCIVTADEEIPGYCWAETSKLLKTSMEKVLNADGRLKTVFMGSVKDTEDKLFKSQGYSSHNISTWPSENFTLTFQPFVDPSVIDNVSLNIGLEYGCPWDDERYIVSELVLQGLPTEIDETLFLAHNVFEKDPYQLVKLCSLDETVHQQHE